jgi:hypothetical protein
MKQMIQKPSVGRIVHFYVSAPELQSNGVGDGPYAAIITQVFARDPSGAADIDSYVNLKVFMPFGEVRDHGSVRHKDFDGDTGRYWVWPERV